MTEGSETACGMRLANACAVCLEWFTVFRAWALSRQLWESGFGVSGPRAWRSSSEFASSDLHCEQREGLIALELPVLHLRLEAVLCAD